MSNKCEACRDGRSLGFDISMAFHPLVDVERGEIFGHEALVRGPQGEPAGTIFEKVSDDLLYAFDQRCRKTAIEMAAGLSLETLLSINFLSGAVYNPEACLQLTLEVAEQHDFPLARILFEVSEAERVIDIPHLIDIFSTYRARGLLTAFDDFGAGFSGLNLLADFQPDFVKLDMGLVRGVDTDKARQAVIRHVTALCADLDVRLIAEGVETADELMALRDVGIDLSRASTLRSRCSNGWHRQATSPICLRAKPVRSSRRPALSWPRRKTVARCPVGRTHTRPWRTSSRRRSSNGHRGRRFLRRTRRAPKG